MAFGGDFESRLDQGLTRALGAQSGPSPLATQATYHAVHLAGGVGLSSSSTVLAALTGKFAVGAATASIIVAGGTAAAAAAGSGSLSPTNWGQYISQTVVPDCKAAASAAGLHGIGSCVSSIARLHGQEVASAARQHGAGADAAHGHSAQAPGHEEASEGRLNGAENGRAPSQPGEGSNNQGHPSGAGAAGDHGAPPKR